MIEKDKPLRVVFLGAPASGKGTQAEKFTDKFHRPHISTGDILRNIKSDTVNPLAQEVAGYIDNGKLAPTELVNRLVADRIRQDDCKNGFVLDGFPRKLEQAVYLDGITDLSAVFLIDVSDAMVIERISGRRVCQNSHTFHLKFSPPKDPAICDVCGASLYQREDDKPETIAGRLAIYHSETDAIVKYYDKQAKLIRIDGEKSVDDVFQQVVCGLVDD